ncbi:hypothetical protein [Actinokineospora globicatena]|uniref:Uncharacterized protein n=1 Tax=Actinokineospora globicatena TaxID=103729 RepID=A0A9W6QP82_9PSEU|nr:hypothetical protein [Actinokineospora globicatena]MCP2301412.1 hypothetical protein [Actinokineospora globicatena]GLW76949.1 hypothetical protein Aglo01_14310 [Actinokineospora globicatena]GLW83782.1 hypothetical protein Aglo02_14220 [Actinokineospora globicatena]GLW92275.1 hypothetical protein Aglo03_30910 [Actinokineospora globicatena]
MTAADPERLLTDALRAQAARTPVAEPVDDPGTLAAARAEQGLPPRAWWVLALALLLGLAAGSLVGFLTLLR